MADSEFWHRTADERAAEIVRLCSENSSLREDISRYVSRDTERLAEVEKLREALEVIAFDPSVSDLNGNPQTWSCTIAYLALGGKIKDGVRQDSKDDLARARAVLTGTEAPPAAESPSDATSTTKDT